MDCPIEFPRNKLRSSNVQIAVPIDITCRYWPQKVVLPHDYMPGPFPVDTSVLPPDDGAIDHCQSIRVTIIIDVLCEKLTMTVWLDERKSRIDFVADPGAAIRVGVFQPDQRTDRAHWKIILIKENVRVAVAIKICDFMSQNVDL